ncbi:ATP-binding protein [Ideonella sp.]|uniref:ATP-binding protein n=1 Tax=Ideonella sp. TaxID=1929293 RepID=UPI0035B28D0F
MTDAPAPSRLIDASDLPGLADAGARAAQPDRAAGRAHLLQLIQLRWLAAGGQLVTILGVQFMLEVPLPLVEMLTLLGMLVAFNLASAARSRLSLPVRQAELFVGLVVDVAVLTGQLFFSGGITNPFIYLYLLQVAVAAVLLRPRYRWATVALTCLGFVGLTQWHRPLAMPEVASANLPPQYIGGLLLCFLLNAGLLVVFIGRIGRTLRQRDARLADLRQRAAEEEHIVRMGLLASGAAHELGTPLATLSVILGDWARMAPFAAEPELREEIEEMQLQIQRCKHIVSAILQSAGESRAEAPAATTLHAFLDHLADDWRRTRPVTRLDYRRDGVPELAIVSDAALKQMIDNILDNALEAAPDRPVTLIAAAEDEQLVLRVLDEGPGFAPEMLARFGKPYQSTKGRPGSGLGLFLAVNVARTLGGHLVAANRALGGAEVTLTLPLSALARPEWA